MTKVKDKDGYTPDLFDDDGPEDVDFPPYARGRETSFKAAESVAEITGRLSKMVYEFIFNRHVFGATCDEVEDILDLKHQTVSSRIWELHRKYHIKDSGITRRTRSNRAAIVWIVPPKPSP